MQDHYSAHQGVEHDDMNILCMGGRVVGPLAAQDLVDAFLGASFTGEERHLRQASGKWLRSRRLFRREMRMTVTEEAPVVADKLATGRRPELSTWIEDRPERDEF